ncbi:ABC transporter ATP-binding protein [Desulfonema magnum]|uniref:ABC transporter, ATP-binding protein n=1 Tax=Desulfonema magnum TaxID=45655 RepID=A0A975GQT7_9BACT|nr:ATP-binding cassette domain-containing protein [Desulfonema magnum]QTA90239.1 putative ABC transporter, ATP-binding protein [Desulfonema magnum]
MNGLKIENLYFHTIGPVSLSVAKSECVGIMGPSGAGKTLFLRAIADMDPHTGKIFLNGTESAQISGHQWRRQVGLLPAESSWWLDTVGEHFDKNINKKWLSAVGFDADVAKWEISRLSSGERQRLALLRLLANRPECLLLDEPTANLDPENITRVEKFLETYQRENKPSVIWVSHDSEQLSRISTRCFILKNKSLIINHKSQITNEHHFPDTV